MSEDLASADNPENDRRTKAIIAGMGILLLLAVIGGTSWVFSFAESERARDRLSWQVRMGIVADSRATELERYVAELLDIPRSLSDNAALQLYLTLLTSGGDELVADPAEEAYLRNLIVLTAEREGFTNPQGESSVPANVDIKGVAGIALLDASGAIKVATRGMPPLGDEVQAALSQARQGKFALVDIYDRANQDPAIGFAGPVYGVQDTSDNPAPIGFVVGVKPVTAAFYNLLKQPGESTKTGENLLVRRVANNIQYLSRRADGAAPMDGLLTDDPAGLAAAYALSEIGGFATRPNYAGTPVLVTSRAVPGTDWVVARMVSEAEAMDPTERRLQIITAVLVLLLLGVAITIIAVWRHGTSVRFARIATNYKEVSEALEAQTGFLTTVTDAQPTAISVVSNEGTFSFANRQSADEAGTTKEDIIGKTLANALGAARAAEFEKLNRQVLITGEPATDTVAVELDDGQKFLKSDHIPLDKDTAGKARSVLMITEDVTGVVQAQERQRQMLRDVVKVLVGLVDKRDPFSANHSAKVAEVSVAVAAEMGAGTAVEQTVDIAGNLMNLGKILVPEELLTKTERLTNEEFEIVRGSILRGADLLRSVRFELPIVEVLEQMQENWDGSGYPAGLTGDAIGQGARIVSVANAFVAMVSPRAFRDAMPFDAAAKLLMQDAQKKFDIKPVSALVNVIENRGGSERWAYFREQPGAAPD
ncbi:MAG: HD domain-containing phosphohydrolase [Magnetospiraceae bacterium]